MAGRACLHGISSSSSAGPGSGRLNVPRVLVDGEICKLPGLTSDAVSF